jgi:peptidyl-dipeptidase A
MPLTSAVSNASRMRWFGLFLVAIAAIAPAAYGQSTDSKPKTSSAPKAAGSAPTVAEAERFISQAETRLLDLWIKSGRASWVSENFITDDTEQISADADAAVKAATAELANEAKRYEKLPLPPDVARKFKLLKLSVDIPAPRDPAAQAELAKIDASLDSDYGKGTWCPDDKKENCKQLPDIEKILANSRDPKELLAAWKGWHAIAPPMKKRYTRMVELSNQGAREMGFADVGAMWRSNYDMPPDDFAKEVDRLWEQVRPLYLSLHAYVRWKLAEKYGKDVVREDEPIPAHLLGNMWSQTWNNIYPLLAPNADSGPDVSAALRAKNVDAQGMVHDAEGFFKSLGFEPLPSHSGNARSSPSRATATWSATPARGASTSRTICGSRSALSRPPRISPRSTTSWATIFISARTTIFRRCFMNSANDGFHEAIGDTIALSVTPEYLKKIGLIDTVPPPSADIGSCSIARSTKWPFFRSACSSISGAGKCFPVKSSPRITTNRGGSCAGNIKGSRRPLPAAKTISIPAPNITWPPTFPTRVISSPTFCNSNFIARFCKEAGYTGPSESLLDLRK